MAAMSMATDIGMGHPLDWGLRVCRLAVLFGGRLGLPTETLQRVYYLSLLGHIGCTANTHDVARLLGDDILMSSHLGTTDLSRPAEALTFMAGHIRRAFPPAARPRAVVRAATASKMFKQGAVAVCEVARLLGGRIGFDADFLSDLDSMYEQWDGKGFPGRQRGDEVTVPARVVQVAALASQASASDAGPSGANELVQARAGKAFDPAMADAFVANARGLLDEQPAGSLWDEVVALEPAPLRRLSEEGLDAALRAMADFVDLKSPFLVGHSSGVAELAAAATERMGLPANDALTARRAGWVHDVGRAGISSGIWGKKGPLTADERERIRLHPYLTDRVLARPAFLRGLSGIASMHHERLDGTGYFRGAPAAQQPPLARILAAADAYHAMTEARPHRPAMEPGLAERELRAEVRAGRMASDAVDAVLEAAGQPARGRRETVAGLTAREVEVLRLLARGLSIREIGRTLFVAPKTADAHIQHIYAKARVSTRAAATMFAMQHDLL
jgi:HD-GYP domain-containing protein (c-di-GMP phosphodiesterase class II)